MEKNLYLGIDIGTYETKGVLVDITGKIIAQSKKSHKLIIPQKGWAEHRSGCRGSRFHSCPSACQA